MTNADLIKALVEALNEAPADAQVLFLDETLCSYQVQSFKVDEFGNIELSYLPEEEN